MGSSFSHMAANRCLCLFVLQVNLTRIRDFLLGEEFKKPTPCDPATGNIVQFHHADLSWRSTSTDEDTKAKTKMSSESKEEPDFSFKDVHLSVKRGELVGVCGRVGSGKSTLLASVIGETSVSHGRVHARACSACSSVALTINSYIEICSGTEESLSLFYSVITLVNLKCSLESPLMGLLPMFCALWHNDTNSNACSECFPSYSGKLGICC